MSIYNYLDYRQYISDEVSQRKKLGSSLNFSKLSSKSGIQNTYLSNALKGRAHLNSDQIFSVAQVLQLETAETDYLLLLLEHNKSDNKERKKILKEKIINIQNEMKKTEKHLKAKALDQDYARNLTDYYLDPYTQVIHVMLGLEGNSSLPENIAAALGISDAHMESCLQALKKVHFIEISAEGVVSVLKKNHHLPKDSTLCLPHQLLMRMKSIDHMQRVPKERRHSVSVAFSGDQQTAEKIHSSFLDFLKSCEPVVKKASATEAFQLNFDLFPWDIREA